MSNKLEPEVESLINHVGEFIDYWGFKAIEGKIWCLTFLSDKPLGPADYINAFGISKGLVSQCVKRLVEYNVILEVAEPGRKKQFYTANPDIMNVVKGVLKKRESEILKNVESTSNTVAKLSLEELSGSGIDKAKLKDLTRMTQTAKSMLEIFLFDESNDLF